MANELTLPDYIITHMPWPDTYAYSIRLSLRHQLNYRVAQFRKALTLLKADDPRRIDFESALRQAYARRRYYKRLYGKNRSLWGR